VEGSSAAVDEALGEGIEALATRYELREGAADALLALVGFADWWQPNFVPKRDPGHGARAAKDRVGKKPARIALNTVAASLAGLELEPVRAARRLADVGTGAGFPGLVLAIALPQTRVALIEKRKETCLYLRRVADELGLDNVRVVKVRAQRWPEGESAFDVATSRNAARVDIMVRMSAPLVARGGAVVLWMRRRNPAKEELAAEAAKVVGLRPTGVHRSDFGPGTGITAKHLYVYEKVATGQPDARER
jgi:16S rRNA (guanine527-N7)-methyltransferase